MKIFLILNILVFTVIVLCIGESQNNRNNIEYIFTYPQSMTSARNTTACLSLKNVKLPGNLTVTFKQSKCNNAECKTSIIVTKHTQCYELSVPKTEKTQPESVKIRLTVDGQTIEENGFNDIVIFPNKNFLLVETDKARYKQNDLVKIRILSLNYDTTPAVNKIIPEAILYIHHYKPTKTWKNILLPNGLAQLEYQLQSTDPTGYWHFKIPSEKVYVGFHVGYQPLQRFHATLIRPKKFYLDGKNVNLTLCAKYSFGGGPVKGDGEIIANGNYFNNSGKTLQKLEKLKNGCVTLQAPVNNLEVEKGWQYYLNVTGSVTEENTGEIKNATGFTITLYENPYNVRLQNVVLKFGLPYRGILIIGDRKIDLTGKIMTLCYNFRAPRWSYDSIKVTIGCHDIIIANNEKIYFTIPPLKRFSRRLILIEVMINDLVPKTYPMEIELIPYDSNSNNSIQIFIEDRDEYKSCNEAIIVKVLYTYHNFTEEEIAFSYMLLSRDDVIRTGYISVKTEGETYNQSKYENVLKSESRFIEKDALIGEFEINVKLDGKIFDKGRLIVYYMVNGEIIADEIFIDNRQSCLPNMVNIKWNKDFLQPTENASLKISAGKESLCALTGIDKDTYQLTANTFTAENILKRMERRKDGFDDYYNNKQSGMSCEKTLKPKVKKWSTYLEQFLEGHLKSNIIVTQPENLDELRQRIVNEYHQTTPIMLNHVRDGFQSRLYYCMEVNGGQFEHLI